MQNKIPFITPSSSLLDNLQRVVSSDCIILLVCFGLATYTVQMPNFKLLMLITIQNKEQPHIFPFEELEQEKLGHFLLKK